MRRLVVIVFGFLFCFGFFLINSSNSAIAAPKSAKNPDVSARKSSDNSSVSDSSAVNSPIGDKWALLVGISKFQDSRIPGLKYSGKDAKDFADFLVSHEKFAPDHVRLLVDDQATRANILGNLGGTWLPRMAHPDDLVVLYFSSHGSPADLDIDEVNYLVTSDTDIDNLYATGIPMQELTHMIKARVHSERIVIFLDACHSGATDPSGKGIVRTGNMDAATFAQGTGQLVVSSSRPSQRSFESKRCQNGVFTRHLIDALNIKGSATTLGEAFDYLKQNVQDEVLKDHGMLQTPVLRSQWSGTDLVLAAQPVHPRPGENASTTPATSTSNATPTPGTTPNTVSTVSPQGGAAYVDRERVVQAWKTFQHTANQLQLMEDGVRKAVQDANNTYIAEKKKGTPDSQMQSMQKRLQDDIDAKTKEVRDMAATMEADAKKNLGGAITDEAKSRGFNTFVFDKTDNCVDITDGVIERLNR